jgi:hypothetical protein
MVVAEIPMSKKMIFSLLFVLFAAPLAAQSLFEGRHVLVMLQTKENRNLIEARNLIESNGGHITQIFPPDILHGYLTDKSETAVKKTGWVKFITDQPVDTQKTRYSFTQNFGLSAWNSLFVKTLATRGDEKKGDQDHNVLRAPDLDNAYKLTLRGQKNFYLTSEYMIASIAVGIVFVESDGTFDKKTESWTDEDKADVVSQIYKGFDWWAETGGYKSGLSWTYDIQSCTTKYEPINRTKDESVLWVNECIGKLGYKDGEDYALNRQYANDLRDKYKTDWSFVLYVVPATNDEDGYFANQTGIAWAYLGGPYMIISNKCNGWGFNQVWKVVAHETGHVFNALDEYKGSSSGIDKSGRLNVVNGNHEVGGVKKEPCMMKANDLKLCEFTRGQIGWIDNDSNGIYDSDYLNLSTKYHADKVKSEKSTAGETIKTPTRFSAEENLLYAEDFSQKDGWFEDEHNYVKDGVYHMYDPQYGTSSWLEKPYSDFVATVKTQRLEGSMTNGYGLMFRIQGPDDNYLFFINGNGQYCVGKYVGGNWSYIQAWTPSNAILPGGPNLLQVKAVGNSFSLRINDRLVAEVSDNAFAQGNVGFTVLPQVHVTFDDLVIRRP